MPSVITMYDHVSFYKEHLIDITSEGQQYSIFYNPIIEEFFVHESSYVDGNLRCKNPSTNFGRLDEIWETYTNIPEDQKALTVRAFNKRIVDERKQKTLNGKANRAPKGRPSHPYLREAALWALANKLPEESDYLLIKRAYEKYKELSPNLKAFGNSVIYNWIKIKKEHKEWQQTNVTKNTNPLEIFAKKKLRKLKTVNKNEVQK